MQPLNEIKISVIGLGYVGLPLAVELSKHFETIGFDINSNRVNHLNSGVDQTCEVSEKEFKEKVFFGTRSIRVRGNVVTKIVGGMDGLDEYEANKLNNKILARLEKNKGETHIPIKQGLNFSYALDTFKEIVAFHKQLANKRTIGKDLGGKLNVDDLQLDSQNEYIIEKEKEKLKFTNEEDNSIDGTLVFDDLPSENKNLENNNEMPENLFD